MTLLGIDASDYQAGLPDAAIKADFIIEKATEGIGYVNPDCNPSYQEAKTAGKLLGVYHFARPDANDAVAEAGYFVRNVQGYVGEAVLALDWEHEAGTADHTWDVQWALRWLDEVYRLTGVRPLIYMNTSTANAYDWRPVSANYALWVAQYWDNIIDTNYDMTNAGPLPNVNGTYWPNAYAMWQWTSSGRLDGYGKNLDCSIFYGSAASWKKFADPSKPNPVITVENLYVTSDVAFDSTTVYSDDYPQGSTQVTTPGVNGVRTQTYQVTKSDGNETGRTLISDLVTTAPVIQVTTIGTHVDPPAPVDPTTPTTPTDPTTPTPPSKPDTGSVIINFLISAFRGIVSVLSKFFGKEKK